MPEQPPTTDPAPVPVLATEPAPPDADEDNGRPLAGTGPPPATPPGRRIAVLRVGIYLLSGLIIGCSAGLVALLSQPMAEIQQLNRYRPALSTRVYAVDGSLFAEFALERRMLLPLRAIPEQLREAFLAIEDDRFYDHMGVSPRGITRAMIGNLLAGRIRSGGSTITQQLARNLFLTFEVSYTRKIREAILALQIERRFSKDEILEMYLNQINLGAGYHGVGMAARGYFDKDVSELTLAEAALLAAIPKGPTRYSPRRNPERAIGRRNLVLRRLHELEWIDTAAYRTARNEPLALKAATNTKATAGYFGEHVRQIIYRDYGYDTLYKSGLRIETTVDPGMQRAAEAAVAAGLARLEQRRAEEFDTRRVRELRRVARERALEYEELSRAALEEELADVVPAANPEFKEIQAGLVAVDVQTGAIRALVGGRDFMESEFNRATQARRQLGSSFKPIVWAAALERGWTPSDIVVDAPIIFHYERDGETMEWVPENYEQRFFGPTTLREALEHSRNIVAIKLLNEIGIGTTVRLARRMGIQSYLDRNLTLALGSSSATLVEVAGAYTSFANQGVVVRPYTIARIHGADGELVFEHTPDERIAMSEETAYLITTLLQGVVQRGTARRTLRGFGRPVAGKTGTTDDCTDAWFVGYTPEIACAVWVGYDQVQPLGDRWTGGRVAAPIWKDFMSTVLADLPVRDFVAPPTIVVRRIEPDSGLLAPKNYPQRKSILQAFVRGTEPQEEYVPGYDAETTYQPLHLYESDESGRRL